MYQWYMYDRVINSYFMIKNYVKYCIYTENDTKEII